MPSCPPISLSFNESCYDRPVIKLHVFLICMYVLYILVVPVPYIFSSQNEHVLDADRSPWGTTFIASTPFEEVMFHPKSHIDWDPTLNVVREIDANGDVLWEQQDMGFAHELVILPTNHLLVARTGYDDLVEIDYPNHNIVWTWRPEDVNWTQVNPNWDANHYYNNKRDFDWSHLNHVAFKQYPTWNACLISLRNFDMIIELNYTAERSGDFHNPANIVWTYGDWGNYTMLRHQHNPDYTPDGNIMVADSRNSRVVEINYTTKQQVWEYTTGLQWCRDADVLSNGNILIVDSNEVLEVEKATKRVVHRYWFGIAAPYDADELDDATLLVAVGFAGYVTEINRSTGTMHRIYGTFNMAYMCWGFAAVLIIGDVVLYGASRKRRSDGIRFGLFATFTLAFCVWFAQVMSGCLYALILLNSLA